MLKRDLIEEVAWRHRQYSVREVEVMVNAVFAGMVQALARGEQIELRGFGCFSVKHRRAGERRNPKTGEPVFVPAKKVPFFKVAKELRLRVDGKGAPARGINMVS